MSEHKMVAVYDNMRFGQSWRLVERDGLAVFHQFGVDYEEFETGAGNFSVAIIEWSDGQVEMVRADRIKFVTPTI